MSYKLFKLLLNHELYSKYETKISSKLIPEKLKPVYDSLIDCHKKYKRNITVAELWEKFKVDNPTYTESRKVEVRALLKQVRDAEDIGIDIAKEILSKAWLEELNRQAADKMLRLAEGYDEDISEVEEIIHKIKSGNILEDSVEYLPTDLTLLEEELQNDRKYSWVLPSVQKSIGNVGGGLFTIVAARTDAGKTAFWVANAFSPGGWADQGAKVHIVGNEEPVRKTLIRSVSAYSGLPKEQILENLSSASSLIKPIADNMFFIRDAISSMDSIEKVENYVFNNRDNIDILIIDQLDHLSVRGNYSRSDERYGSLYRAARAIAIKYDIYVVAMTQASAEAHGKLYFGSECLEGSKTAKQAHADIICCIGMEDIANNGGEDTMIRALTLGKLKEGEKTKAPIYRLNGALSRIED